MNRLSLCGLLALIGVGLSGCNTRGADDRVALREDQRQANHGPGYTVVALRKVDRARMSNSGVVIVNDAGWEPVYVNQVAYTRNTAEESRANVEQLENIQSRLDAISAQLRPTTGATPAAVERVETPSQADSGSPVVPATPAPVVPLSQFKDPPVEAVDPVRGDSKSLEAPVAAEAPAPTAVGETAPAPTAVAETEAPNLIRTSAGRVITDGSGKPVQVGPKQRPHLKDNERKP